MYKEGASQLILLQKGRREERRKDSLAVLTGGHKRFWGRFNSGV